MTRCRNKIHARIPEPDENVTMTTGSKTVVDAVFADTGLDVSLDGLKRIQGNSVAAEAAALVANSVEMTGISVNRIDRVLEEDVIREGYGLGANAPKSPYRTVERLGEHSDEIVKYLGGVLKKQYGVKTDTVFMDRTSPFSEAPQQGMVRAGYSGDHGPGQASGDRRAEHGQGIRYAGGTDGECGEHAGCHAFRGHVSADQTSASRGCHDRLRQRSLLEEELRPLRQGGHRFRDRTAAERFGR